MLTLFSPTFLMLLLWLPQIIVHYIWDDAFDPFVSGTWLAVSVALTAVLAGNAVGAMFPYVHDSQKRYSAGRLVKKFCWLFALAIAGVAWWMMMSAGTFDPVAIRQAVIAAKFDGSGIYDQPVKVLLAGIAFCLYFLCEAENLTRRQIAMLLGLGLVAAILTTGRLQLLLFVLAATAILTRRGIFKRWHLVWAGIAFIVLFLGIAVVMGKGTEDVNGASTLTEQIAWNLKVYVFGSLSCFNDAMKYGYAGGTGPLMTPNFLREWLIIAPRDPINPFVEVPFNCNTYTAIFPVMHDYGYLGVALMFSGLGLMHQRLYMRYIASDSSIWIYLYALSLYPLAMTIFEDAYFSSYGMWAILWLPLVFHMAAAIPASSANPAPLHPAHRPD